MNVEAGNFCGVQRMLCPNFHKFPEKFYATNVLPTKFLQKFLQLLIYHVVLYHVAVYLKLENLLLKIGFLITQLKMYASCVNERSLSETSVLGNFEHLPHNFEVFQLHSSCCCQQETFDLAEVGLKLLPSLKTYSICDISGMYILFIFYDCAMSLTTLILQLHIQATYNNNGKTRSSKHCN